jgi:drug/metabolite transporter (DMT)-like permease
LYPGGFLPFVATVPTLYGCELMLLLGFAGVTSHFCLIRALTAALANMIAPFSYTSLLWATLFSLLIFAEVPALHTIIGAGLIAGAGLFIFLGEKKLK